MSAATTPRTINPRVRRPNFSVNQPKKSASRTIIMVVFLVYSLLPIAWLLISATKTQSDLFNIVGTVTYRDGIFLRWFGNTMLYVLLGAGGATILSALAGYGLAKYRFPGRNAYFAVILGAIAVPGTALAVPTFLLFSQVGLTNTPWAVIIPSLVSPFGLYLMWVFANEAVPTELLEAARIDGASEMRTFFSITIKLLAPGIVTVALFAIVATWNNYFLPLIMLTDPKWFPLTIGLNQWNSQAQGVGADPIFNFVITGSLLAIIPIVVIFLFLQRYWQSGLAAGSVKQ
jgi:multiple sugar transport system permease protein